MASGPSATSQLPQRRSRFPHSWSWRRQRDRGLLRFMRKNRSSAVYVKERCPGDVHRTARALGARAAIHVSLRNVMSSSCDRWCCDVAGQYHNRAPSAWRIRVLPRCCAGFAVLLNSVLADSPLPSPFPNKLLSLLPFRTSRNLGSRCLLIVRQLDAAHRSLQTDAFAVDAIVRLIVSIHLTSVSQPAPVPTRQPPCA